MRVVPSAPYKLHGDTLRRGGARCSHAAAFLEVEALRTEPRTGGRMTTGDIPAGDIDLAETERVQSTLYGPSATDRCSEPLYRFISEYDDIVGAFMFTIMMATQMEEMRNIAARARPSQKHGASARPIEGNSWIRGRPRIPHSRSETSRPVYAPLAKYKTVLQIRCAEIS